MPLESGIGHLTDNMRFPIALISNCAFVLISTFVIDMQTTENIHASIASTMMDCGDDCIPSNVAAMALACGDGTRSLVCGGICINL